MYRPGTTLSASRPQRTCGVGMNCSRRTLAGGRSRRAFSPGRLHQVWAVATLAAAGAAIFSPPARAQEEYQFEHDLVAKGRLYDQVGAGFREVHRGPDGNYYVLIAPAPAVQIYDPSGNRIGQAFGVYGGRSPWSLRAPGRGFRRQAEGTLPAASFRRRIPSGHAWFRSRRVV